MRFRNGIAAWLDYDAAGRPLRVRDAAGNAIERAFDPEGRELAVAIQDAAGQPLYGRMNLWDANGRLLARVLPEGIDALYARQPDGALKIAFEGRAGPYEPLPAAHGYAERAADGGLTRFVRGRGAWLIGDAQGRLHGRVLDDFGRLVLEHNADKGVATYAYDADGRGARRRDALGQIIAIRWDEGGRLIRKSSPECLVHYRYNPRGRLAEVQGCGESQAFGYDAAGAIAEHVQSIERPGLAALRFVVRYRYDPTSGQLIERDLPDGQTLSYEYRAQAARLSRIAVKPRHWFERERPILTEVRYAAFGPRTHIAYGNGVQWTQSLDRGFAATGVTTALPPPESDRSWWRAIGLPAARADDAPVLDRLVLRRDPRRRVAALEQDGATLALDYDAASRLQRIGAQAPLSYDRLGRRQDDIPQGDALGRAAQHDGWTLIWSSEDRLLRAERGTGAQRETIEYRYNSAGQRLARVHTDAHGHRHVSYTFYDLQGRLAAEADAAGAITRQYLYLGLQPIAVLDADRAAAWEGRSTEVAFIHTDHLGSPRLVTDENRRVLWRARFDPWGRVEAIDAIEPPAAGMRAWARRLWAALSPTAAQAQDGSAPHFALALRLPGMLDDTALGLYYNHQRWYDPGRGRYVSADPLGIAEGLNQYAYVANRPLDGIDPWGQFGIDIGTEGQGIHEDIVREAFRRSLYGGSFSSFFIEQVALANWYTDRSQSNQFDPRNHFDNPNDTPGGWPDGRQFFPNWIEQTLASINGKRDEYDTVQYTTLNGLSQLDREHVNLFYQLPANRCPQFVDIRDSLLAFGENTHTLADFYAHSNWVDLDGRGGNYVQEKLVELPMSPPQPKEYVKVTDEEGTVPRGLGRTTVWDESVTSNLYTGNAEGCSTLACAVSALKTGSPEKYAHNTFKGVDAFNNPDKTTHAYWNKDSPDAEHPGALLASNVPGMTAHQLARELAIQHTIKEIERQYNAAGNNPQLRQVFKMDEKQMRQNLVLYFVHRQGSLLRGTRDRIP